MDQPRREINNMDFKDFGPQLLSTFLESLGVDPNNQEHIDRQALSDCLFPELHHKLREIIQEAKKIMRHSKRDYLTQGDIKLALKKLNFGDQSSMLLGYPSHVPFQYIKMGPTQGSSAANQGNASQMNPGGVPKAAGGNQDQEMDNAMRSRSGNYKSQNEMNAAGQGNFIALGVNNEPIYDHGLQQNTEQAVWFQKSEQIDLKDYIFNNCKAQGSKYNRSGSKSHRDLFQTQQDQQLPLKMTYEMHFVAINGVQPNIPQNVEESFNLESKSIDMKNQPKMQPEITGKNVVRAQDADKPENESAGGEPTKQESLQQQYVSQQSHLIQQSILNPSLLTRELDAFYNIFIDKFQKIEEDLRQNQLSSSSNENLYFIEKILKGGKSSFSMNAELNSSANKTEQSTFQNKKTKDKNKEAKNANQQQAATSMDQYCGANFVLRIEKDYEAFSDILRQLETQPSLKDLFPHIIHFIQSKVLHLLQAKPAIDALIEYLLLDTLESLINNWFFQVDVKIAEMLSILLSVAMQEKFHVQTTDCSIVLLKEKNGRILSNLLSKTRNDLTSDCANILLKSICDLKMSNSSDEGGDANVQNEQAIRPEHQYKILGCLLCLQHLIKAGKKQSLRDALHQNIDKVMDSIRSVQAVHLLEPSLLQHQPEDDLATNPQQTNIPNGQSITANTAKQSSQIMQKCEDIIAELINK